MSRRKSRRPSSGIEAMRLLASRQAISREADPEKSKTHLAEKIARWYTGNPLEVEDGSAGPFEPIEGQWERDQWDFNAVGGWGTWEVLSLKSLLFTAPMVVRAAESSGKLPDADPVSISRLLLEEELEEIESLLSERGSMTEADSQLLDGVVRAVARYSELLFARHMALVSARFDQMAALQNKKSRVGAEEAAQIRKMNDLSKAQYPKKTPRYQEIAKRLDIKLDRVRYVLEGPRRRKK